MLIGQVCDFGNDGDAHYRIHAPSRYLGKLPGVYTVDCHFSHRRLSQVIECADVLVIQFVNDWDFLSICDYRRRSGKITIFEANDYFFDLQPWSPIVSGWCDRETQELYRKLIIHADGVQTSTHFLADKWRISGARQVTVFENHMTDIPDLVSMPHRPFTVGWAGSPGHFADLLHIVPALQTWLEQHPEARLAIMTNELAQSFFRLPAHQLVFQNFGPLEQYLHFLRSLDVGLAPLLPTDYNRGRSDVKYLEYSSHGVPGIYQHLEPYRDIVKDGQTGFLCRSPSELIEKLDELYKNRELRERVRANAYAYVRADRLLENNIRQRLDWYRSFNSSTMSDKSLFLRDLQPHRESPATAYYTLRAEQSEQQFLTASKETQPHISVPCLLSLLEQLPDYGTAASLLVHKLNDLRRPQETLLRQQILSQIAPYAMKWRLEICRAYFLINDTTKAFNELEQLLHLYPYFLPTWKYYLRLLALTNHPDSQKVATRCLALFPHCYPIGILAIDNFPFSERFGILTNIITHSTEHVAPFEYHHARRIFRKAVLELIGNKPVSGQTIALLQAVCKRFPESMQLRHLLAEHLQHMGQHQEALDEYARVVEMQMIHIIGQEENRTNSIPYLLQFANYIQKVSSVPDGHEYFESLRT